VSAPGRARHSPDPGALARGTVASVSGEQGDIVISESAPPSGLPPGVTVISIYPMYSAGQVALATFFGGPLGGAWLMALNYKRLAEPGKARIAVLLGVLAVAALIAIGFAAGPDSLLWLMLAPIVVTSWLAKELQGAAYDRHVAVGGSRGSRWRAAGLGVVSLVVYLAAIFGTLTIHYFAIRPDRVMIEHNSVFYTDGVSRAEAQRVGEALFALDGRRDTRWGVEVTRDGDRPVIAFIVSTKQVKPSDDKIEPVLHHYAEPLSREVYGGAPVDIWLIDGLFRQRAKLSWESRPR